MPYRHPYPGSAMRPRPAPPRRTYDPIIAPSRRGGDFELEFELEDSVHSCRPGEGPPATGDPSASTPRPLSLRGVDRTTSRNPSVGLAQRLLNIFLDRVQNSAFPCSSPSATAFVQQGLAQLRAQRQLPLAIDCRFGPATQLATKMFQVCVGPPLVGKNGLPDGKIGPITWPRLEALARSAPPPPPPPPPPTRCPPESCTPPRVFLPSLHAFKFTNSFSLSGWSALRSVPSIIRSLFTSGRFGLCGGMSTAALDYFLSCIHIPSTSAIPSAGDPLFNYLGTRQLDSLEFPSMRLIGQYLLWTNLPDDSVSTPSIPIPIGPLPIPVPSVTIVKGLRELTVPEFRDTLAKLRAGERVVLGLIYAGPGSAAIWENHQVLAYATSSMVPGTTDIRIYDPNFPGNDFIVIRCTLNAAGDRVDCTEFNISSPASPRLIEKVRGFFIMPYRRSVPPCIP